MSRHLATMSVLPVTLSVIATAGTSLKLKGHTGQKCPRHSSARSGLPTGRSSSGEWSEWNQDWERRLEER